MNKYIITDNRGYESYLEIGEVVCVIGRITTGMEETTKKGSDGLPLWIRGAMCTKDTHCIKDNASCKETNKIERVICIPDSGGHTLDLQRVQYISPLEKGSYKVTLVSTINR